MDNFVMLALTYAWVAIVIAIAIGVKKAFNLDVEVSRKLIHLFAGQVIFLVPLFDTPALSMITGLSFLLLIYLSGPKSPFPFLRAMFEGMARESEEEHIWGPFYYAISINILIGISTIPLLFGVDFLMKRYVFIGAALNAMYIGDGLAPLVAKNSERKTLRGSVVMFAGSVAGALLSIVLLSPEMSIGSILLISLLTGAVATLLERYSGRYDNIATPCGVASTLILLDIIIGIMR